MLHAASPADLPREAEAARLDAVRRYDILDTPPDGYFDRITALAANLFSAPISIVSLVDEDRIWFKSHHGLDVEQIDRGPGLCASAILQSEPWVLGDAKTDVRSLTNPLVAGDFGLRFYLGIPLRTHDGFNLGTLCVIDHEPREVTQQQVDQLTHLASVVMDQMELRLSAREAIAKLSDVVMQKDAALRRAELMAKEIDHRVMNSLQLTSSILSLQARGLGASEASNQLAFAANRVTAIARVHQHIYLSDGAEGADCHDYLRRLCGDLSSFLGRGEAGLTVEAVEAVISTREIVPVGLLVNELVTNAAKHGGGGAIRVSFAHGASGGYELAVVDEGPGLPEGFDPKGRHGLGMKVISALVRQLQGELRIGAGPGGKGASLTVWFPASRVL